MRRPIGWLMVLAVLGGEELAAEATELTGEASSFDSDDAAQFQECQTQFSSGG